MIRNGNVSALALRTAVVILVISLLTGCAARKNTMSGSDSNNEPTKEDEQITLTYWTPVHLSSVKIIRNFSENEAYKEKMRRTGINIKFIHPDYGQEKEQYQLMLASDHLPDIIQNTFVAYPGGPDKAIKDGVYLRLNELIEAHAPNFKRLRETNKEVSVLTITDKGNIWGFPVVNMVEETAWRGPIIRKDLLEKFDLDIPSTIDEWYKTLRFFKYMGLEAPLLFPQSGMMPESQFASAFGVANEFYVEDGKVQYGPLQTGYKEYLATMNKWYAEGLIDRDFATRSQSALDALILSDKAGAWVGAPDTGINPYLLKKKNEPGFALTGAPYPTLSKGQTVQIGQKNYACQGWEATITTQCKYPEAAVRFMDFNYSPEGYMLFNYGIEGVSYEMVGDTPVFTELMQNNPDNIDFYTLAWKYKLHMGPYLRDYRAVPPYKPTEKSAREIWAGAGTKNNMPPVIHTSEETTKLSSIMGDLNNYRLDMVTKFIMGIEPISNYDEFIVQLKKRRILEVLAIKQAALERMQAR